MSFGMIVSDVIYDENEGVWFLDAITAICIAFVLFIYGFRYRKITSVCQTLSSFRKLQRDITRRPYFA